MSSGAEPPVIIGLDLGSEEATAFGFNFGHGLQMVTMPVGVPRREGFVYSDAGDLMPKLKVKNGRLIAKDDGGIWNIIAAV
jgi:hypothetical protein